MTLSQSEQQRIDALKQSKPAAAAKCARYNDMLAEGMSIALIQLQYKYACNFHCSHCSIAGFRKQAGGRRLDVQAVKRIYDEAHAYGLAHTGISGGEPLVFKELPQIIEAIGPERFHIQLDTNGWLFTPDVAKQVKAWGVDKVQISIDGLDAEAHDAFRRKPGSHERCMQAIDAAKEAGLQLQVATVVDRSRAKSQEFREFMELMYNLGASTAVVFAKPVGEWAGKMDNLCTSDDIHHVRQILARYGGHDHMTPAYGRNFGCIAVKRIISITAFGDVLPCPWMYWTLGNVFDTPLADILNKGVRYFGDYSPVCRLSESKEFCEKYVSKTQGLDYLPTVEEVMGE